MSKIDDRTRLLHIKDGAISAISFMDGKTREDLDRDRMLSFAVVRCLEIIGEAANRTSDEVQQKYPLIPWREVVGMRNRIVHAYFDVDLDIIWQVVKVDLPQLLPLIDRAIEELSLTA
jgi:uncharacterized protein with HEPN domain